MTGANIIEKLDALLQANQLDTRAGLYFLGELVKDAFKYIEEQKTHDETIADTLQSFKTRITNVENALNEFLTRRAEEQKEAKEERKFYRRAVIGGIVSIVLSELLRWFLG